MSILRKDLVCPPDLKEVFNSIRNHLAGNFTGITQDQQLVEQLIFLLFCKIRDEIETPPDHPVTIQIDNLSEIPIINRLNLLFDKLKKQYSNILNEDDTLLIDESNLRFIISKIQHYAISEASRDAIGDAFELFILPSLRGGQGQFFTPKNISQTIAQILSPTVHDKVIDPACGAGGFLTSILSLFPNEDEFPEIYGIDKDDFLVKISRLHLALLNNLHSNIFCENSLELTRNWNENTQKAIVLESFDVVLTNPPFGVKIPIIDPTILQDYEIAHKWVKSKDNWIKTQTLKNRLPPQVLFIERCLQLLKPGGRMGIVLPEGIFGNTSERYIINFLLQNFTILAVISCSPLAFMPHTHIKTSLLFIEKKAPSDDYEIFVAIADKVGHDKNGKELYQLDEQGNPIKDDNGRFIIDDDLPTIIRNYKNFKKGIKLKYSTLGYVLRKKEIVDNILIPAYYNPVIKSHLKSFQDQGYILISIEDLISSNQILIHRGHEIGAKHYGTGEIPFVRTSDIVNLEINIDPLKQVNREIYEQFRVKQDIQEGDILFVNDGTYLIGRSAMVTSNEKEIVIQSHLKKIRVIKKDTIDEHLLLWSLNTGIVQEQIKSKIFIQATISTLGNRLKEVVLVLPQNHEDRIRISSEFQEIIKQKVESKAKFKQLIQLP